MSDNTNTCGSTDTSTGEPCGRPAGWGRDADSGHCVDHATDDRVLRKFDNATREQLIGAAERGAYKKHCAQYAGVTEQTLQNWLTWGLEDIEDHKDTALAEFYLGWQRARGRGAVDRLAEVDAEFVLERSYGYTKKEEIEHTGDGLDLNLSVEEKEQLDDLFDREVQS